jgi:hypothetical protein
MEINVEERKNELELADLLLNEFSGSEEMSLPMPRFGKVRLKDQPAKPLPKIGMNAPSESELSWADEEELGLRVFVVEEDGLKGPEVVAYVKGIRPELLGKTVAVSIFADSRPGGLNLRIQLDEPTEDKQGCSGKGSFGAAADIRKRLGEEVVVDVYLLEWPKERPAGAPTPTRECA